MLQDQERAARELADANQRLAEANAQLEEANRRLAAVAEEQAQFFAVTAHELRAPVSVLSGASATLAAHYELLEPDERTEITAAVGRSSQQLRRLLDDLLTAARLQARRLQLDLQPVDVEDVVRTAVTAARQSNRGVEIRTELEPGVTVEADPGRLVQVVDNLVTNAVQHGCGPVDVAMTVRPAVVEVSVRDAGGGVPADLRDRLFEQFSTSSSRGTGLGLFLVRELARAHGGDAWYRPDDHAFVVSLPRGVA
jgi:signal transduction histidine kinase